MTAVRIFDCAARLTGVQLILPIAKTLSVLRKVVPKWNFLKHEEPGVLKSVLQRQFAKN